MEKNKCPLVNQIGESQVIQCATPACANAIALTDDENFHLWEQDAWLPSFFERTGWGGIQAENKDGVSFFALCPEHNFIP